MPVLTVTLGDGSSASVQFDPTDTLLVQGGVTAAWTDVVDVAISADVPPVESSGPAQVVVDPSLEPPVATSGDPGDETPPVVTEPTSADAPADVPADVPAVDAPVVPDAPADVAPVDAPPDTVGAALAAADAATDAPEPTEPTDSGPEDPPVSADGTVLVNLDDAATVADSQAHDEAVTVAQDAVDTAVAQAAPDGHAHLAQAIADVDQALATWPDSQPLLDAKSQLSDLAADLDAENPQAFRVAMQLVDRPILFPGYALQDIQSPNGYVDTMFQSGPPDSRIYLAEQTVHEAAILYGYLPGKDVAVLHARIAELEELNASLIRHHKERDPLFQALKAAMSDDEPKVAA